MIFLYKGYAFRGFNSHGKALLTLVHNALAGRNEDEYVITEGERLCSTAVGWNFGDGHMHNEQLIAAMQERCKFEPGEVRVILLDAQPIPPAAAGVPLGRRRDRGVRARLRGRRRHGDGPAVDRRHARAREWSTDSARDGPSRMTSRTLTVSSPFSSRFARRVEVLAPMRFGRGAVARPHELHQAAVGPHHLLVVGLRHRTALLEDECGVPHRDFVQHARDDAERRVAGQLDQPAVKLARRLGQPTRLPARGDRPRPACGRARRRPPRCLPR